MAGVYFPSLQHSTPTKKYPLKEATVKLDQSTKFCLSLTFADIQRSGKSLFFFFFLHQPLCVVSYVVVRTKQFRAQLKYTRMYTGLYTQLAQFIFLLLKNLKKFLCRVSNKQFESITKKISAGICNLFDKGTIFICGTGRGCVHW